MTEQNEKTLIEAIRLSIKKFIEDSASLEVITARGNIRVPIVPGTDVLTLTELNILARTRIELDGDIIVMLPSKASVSKETNSTSQEDFEIDSEVLQIHNETVRVGIEKWENYLNGILKILELVTSSSFEQRIKELFKKK